MRQLPTSCRIAVWLATSLAVAASAGCMSVGGTGTDQKPASRHPAGRSGGVIRPGVGAGSVAGVSGDVWNRPVAPAGEADDGPGAARPKGPQAKPAPAGGSASPEVTVPGDPTPEATPGGAHHQGHHPHGGTGGGTAGGTDGEVPVDPPSTEPHSDPPESSPAPPVDPGGTTGGGTVPSEDPGEPTVSPPPDVRTSAMLPGSGFGMRREPSATSPQLGPV